jgi:hypothetical protein
MILQENYTLSNGVAIPNGWNQLMMRYILNYAMNIDLSKKKLRLSWTLSLLRESHLK